jgi:flagellar basal body-associated protein FliL
MSEEPKETAEAAPPAPRKSGKVVVIAIAAVALVAGGAAGVFVVGPRLAPHAEAVQDTAKPKPAETDHKVILNIENLIANPAGSLGNRFLMASVAFEVADVDTKEKLKMREVEVRDALLTTLQQEPIDSLTSPGAREGIKRRLAEALTPFAGAAPSQVYLPQFVVQ